MESIHPIVVHFPIALLLAALLLETLALFLKKPGWHAFSLVNLCLGVLGAGGAVLTGQWAEAAAKHSFEIYQLMELHEKIGKGVFCAALTVALVRLAMKDRLKGWLRWAAWAALAAACGAMAFGAHLGGRLVYEFGVGGSYGKSGGIQVVR